MLANLFGTGQDWRGKEAEYPNEPNFVREQIFLIVRKIIEGNFLSPFDLLSMLNSRELIIIEVA